QPSSSGPSGVTLTSSPATVTPSMTSVVSGVNEGSVESTKRYTTGAPSGSVTAVTTSVGGFSLTMASSAGATRVGAGGGSLVRSTVKRQGPPTGPRRPRASVASASHTQALPSARISGTTKLTPPAFAGIGAEVTSGSAPAFSRRRNTTVSASPSGS